MTPPELKAARMLVRSWLTTAGKPNGLVAFELVESALDAATTRAEQAETRIGQLHQTLVRVTHETPFPHEADDLRVQRAKLMAEVGTLKARAEAAERDQARAALADLASCRLCVTGGCSAHQPLTGQIAALQKQLTQREAECAAMRLLLEGARRQYHGELCDDGNGGLDCDCGRDDWNAEIDAALAPGAGQSLLDRLARLEGALRGFVEMADAAIANRERQGGQQVPYHGDFASIPPSTVGDLRRWRDVFRAALAGDHDPEADLIDLLRRMAGDGGRRTSELRRRGWLTWEVTEAGKAALAGEGDKP